MALPRMLSDRAAPGSSLLEDRLDQVADALPQHLGAVIRLLEGDGHLIRFETDRPAASRADELIVRAQPLHRLLGLVAAAGTGE